MWYKKVNHLIVIRIYADGYLIIRKEESIASLIDELKNHEFYLKIERNVSEYLSFCTEESKHKKNLT
jgi:hypothetical protein